MYPTQRSPRIMDNRILSTSISGKKKEEIDMAIECYNLPSRFSGSTSTLVVDSSQPSLMVSSRSKRDAKINYLMVRIDMELALGGSELVLDDALGKQRSSWFYIFYLKIY